MELKRICAEALGIPLDQIDEKTGPATDSRWNSLGHLKLVVALEESYAIRLSQQEIRSLASVGVVRALLERKGVDLR